jgi:hypothetical protein
MNVLDFINEFLGPTQQYQNNVQLPHDEFSAQIELLQTPKDFIQLQKNIVKNLKIVYPNKKIYRDSFTKFYCPQSDILQCSDYTFHKTYFKNFVRKYSLPNPFTLVAWTPEESKLLDLNNEEICVEGKSTILNALKEEMEIKYQDLLSTCRLENIDTLEKSKQKLQDEWEHFVFFIGGFYFQDFLSCIQKVNGFKRTSFALYKSAKEETEFFEYEEKLLEIIYKKCLNSENILSLGVLEDVDPEVCIYIIQKKL